jgi:hypothetical protein
MRKRYCPLLRRIEEREEICFGDLIKGVYYSSDEQVRERLEDYRQRGLIEYEDKRIWAGTVFRPRKRRKKAQ